MNVYICYLGLIGLHYYLMISRWRGCQESVREGLVVCLLERDGLDFIDGLWK